MKKSEGSVKNISKKVLKLSSSIKNTTKTVATTILDQNEDNNFDQEDVKILTEKSIKATKKAADGVSKMLKDAGKSSVVKDATAGAAVGAVVAIPIPIIGPIAGAAVGAGLGVYKNITGKDTISTHSIESKIDKDIYSELLKLEDLRSKSIITEAEFIEQKKRLLE